MPEPAPLPSVVIPARDEARRRPKTLKRVRRLGRPGELALVFWLALGAYLAAAAFLVLHEHMGGGDAYSRVAIAHRILFSRDPHLAAIGFVWGPLPVLAMLPLIPLGSVWPALTTYGFAASIVSALCMAAAAREVAAFLREMGVGAPGRPLLTLAFAAHPMIVLFAANGMSEAMFLLLLLMATRRLAGWLRTGELHLATGAALALAAAYLARYETVAAAGAAVGLVALWAYRRTPGSGRRRLEQAACDAAVVGTPVLFAVAGFALISLAIMGSPFEQYTSAYGNSSVLHTSDGSPTGALGTYGKLVGGQVLALEPFVVVVAAVAAFRAGRHGHRAATLAVLGLVGCVLIFMFWSSARGEVGQELRYMITVVPLSVLTAGAALGATRPRPSSPLVRKGRGGVWRGVPVAGGVMMVLLVASALPVSASEMTSPRLNPSEWGLVRAVYGVRGDAEQRAMRRFVTERRIAADLDAMNLPPGSVLLDDFLGFGIPLDSRNPRQFVITSDRDFQTVLSDPAAAGVTYVLVPEPASLGLLDAINRRYPTLYANGAEMATLVRQYANQGDRLPAYWRLYRLRPEAGP